jgi:hypothetical protein
VDRAKQQAEVDGNYVAFVSKLPMILHAHRDQLALMRGGEIVGYFNKPGEAYRVGLASFSDGIFSIQEVTDEPIDLGFWSHIDNGSRRLG